MDSLRYNQSAVGEYSRAVASFETADLNSAQLEPVPEEYGNIHVSVTQQQSPKKDMSTLYEEDFLSENDGSHREHLVTVRKQDSINRKARPVSTASIDSQKSGIRSQGSVKKKDARPPSIAENDDSVLSHEAAGSNGNESTRFHRRQQAIVSKPQVPSSSGEKESSPQSSLSSFDNEVVFQTPSSSVICSPECDRRVSALEERVCVLEQIEKDRNDLQLTAREDTMTATNSQDPDTLCGVKFITDREHTSMVTMSLPNKLQVGHNVHSAPFFSDDHDSGYQMCIRMDIHESKKSETHLQFSFVIMCGKHDDKLPWPFNRKVTVVCTHTKDGKDSLKSFTIQPNSSKSFECPKSDLNKPRKFLTKSLCEMQSNGFISDNTIVFAVTVI